MRRGRRLSLAPATKRALRPGLIPSKVLEVDPEARRVKGRLELSCFVQMVAALSVRPKPVHGPEFGRFWAVANGERVSDELSEADGSSDSGEVLSTPEFIAEAAAAGVESRDLYRAERELASFGSVAKARKFPKSQLADRIIESMVKRKLYPEAWKGPLPPPRSSPLRTLGDVMEKAREVGQSEWKKVGCRSEDPAALVSQCSKLNQEDLADKAKDLQLLSPDFPELKGPRAAFDASVGSSSGEIASGPEVLTAFTRATVYEAGCGASRARIRPCSGLVALFSRVGTRIKCYSARRRPRSFAEVLREGRRVLTPQGSGMANHHPSASQGSQHPPTHQGGSGASNLGQMAGRGGYHPGFNPSYHPGANRGWQGGGRGRRGARGGHAPLGFAGRGTFGNFNFSGAGRGSGGRGVGRGRGGQVWSANPLASRSLPSNAPPAIASVSSATNLLPEGTVLNSQFNSEEANLRANTQNDNIVPRQNVGKGKNKTPYCFRCLTKGHVLSECSNVLCCEICDSDEHVTKACPFSKGAKPTAVPHGFAVEKMGFYYIDYVGKQKEKKESKMAKVKISGGTMTDLQVSTELERLIPGTVNWEVKALGVNTFAANFPSIDELQRLVRVGPVEAKCTVAKMEFEFKSNPNVFKYEISKVWVQFRGLPEELLEFPIVWAIGSILGVTRKVDMKFVKEFEVGRIQVAVLDAGLVPDLVDIVIGDFVYELQFRVEISDPESSPRPIDMDLDFDPTEDAEEEENYEQEGKESNSDNKKEDLVEGKNRAESGSAPAKMGRQAALSTVTVNSGAVVTGKVRPLVALQSSGYSKKAAWMTVPIGPAAGQANISAQGSNPVAMLVDGPITPVKVGTQLVVTPSRASKRNSGLGDQDSLQRAAKLKAKRNLEVSSSQGHVQSNALAETVGTATKE